jgi:hypothetical protein
MGGCDLCNGGDDAIKPKFTGGRRKTRRGKRGGRRVSKKKPTGPRRNRGAKKIRGGNLSNRDLALLSAEQKIDVPNRINAVLTGKTPI